MTKPKNPAAVALGRRTSVRKRATSKANAAKASAARAADPEKMRAQNTAASRAYWAKRKAATTSSDDP